VSVHTAPNAEPDTSPATESGAQRFPYLAEILTGALYLALLIVMVRQAASPLSNTDTYFHLRFGSEFLHHWSLWHPGSVSTFATASWVPTQWLPEVVMAQTEAWFGLAGVAWLYGVMLVSFLASLYFVARHWARPMTSVLLTMLALFAASHALGMRPQVLSFLLVAVTAGAWLRSREDGRVRWWLIPLTWVWAMVHGMWPIGIAIGVVVVAGMTLDRTFPRPTLQRMALIPLLAAVAAALTPVGPRLYGGLVAVQGRASFFSEWGSPDYTDAACIVLALSLGAAVVLYIRNRSLSYVDLGLLMLTAACAVWSWRTVPVAAMILVPLTAVQAAKLRPGLRVVRRERALVGGASLIALALLALVVPQVADRAPTQPSWVDPALRSLPTDTKVVDSWDWGGYLMWRYPQLDLLMHGYGDTFTTSELQRNTDIVGLAPGWDTELRETGCTIAFLRSSSALAYALEHQEHWKVLHRSSSVVELQAPQSWAPSA
jgi:hypothetical protein